MTADPVLPHAETDRARTRAGYDRVATDYARLLPGLDAETALDVAMIDELAARVLRRSADRGVRPRVLDAGCGTGRVGAHLRARGVDVLGIDLSAGMLATARATHPTLPLVVGDLAALPVGTATIDGVLAWYSWVHTPAEDLPGVVAEAARVLVPGGHLLVAFQAGAGERRVLDQAYGHAVALTHVRHDPARVEHLLAEAGLDVRVRLLRDPEGRERTPQAALLAVRSDRAPAPGLIRGW